MTDLIANGESGSSVRAKLNGQAGNINSNSATRRAILRELAAVRSGERRSKFAIYGDSTNAGWRSGTGGTGNQNAARQRCPAAYAAQILNGRGISARSDAFFGNPTTVAVYPTYNTNVALGADWIVGGGNGLGGSLFQCSTGTTSLVFTPERVSDRIDIYYVAGASFGTFTVTDASGTLATINSAGTNVLTKTTVTRAAASVLPFSIQRNGTGNAIYISGMDPWNSGLAEVCFLNAAAPGSDTADWISTTQVWSKYTAINLVDADVAYIELGLNDKNNGTTVATAKNNLGTIIDRQLLLGGAILGISNPATSGNAFDLTSDWRDGISEVAAAKGISLVDHYQRMISREVDTSIYYDEVHLLAAGCAMKGGLLAALFG